MKSLLLTLLLAVVSVGCTKVIELELNTSEPVLIIEANLRQGSPLSTVLLTESMQFYDEGTPPPVTGAVVTIESSDGTLATMAEYSPGLYATNSVEGVAGQSYTVRIARGDKLHTASATMPRPVELDSVTVITLYRGPVKALALVPHYTDPAGVENFYKFNVWVNESRDHAINVRNDRISDGSDLARPISTRTELLEGDVVTVELQSIDKQTYNFFYTLRQGQGAMTASPANPASMFTGNCIGYLNPAASSIKVVVIE